MIRLLRLLALSAVPALAAEPLTYFQDWFPGAQFAGLYAAVDRGFFRDEGLDLTVHPFAFGQDVPALMDRDPSRAAVGTLEGYILLEKRAKGADLVALNAVLRESPAGYMALPRTAARSARDFAGKRIGVHKYGDPLYRLFLRRASIEPSAATMVFVDDDLGRLLRGDVDFMQGYAIEELVKLRRIEPAARFLPFSTLGFDAYSQVVFSTRAQADAHARVLRAFIDALRKGWAYALAHPGEAADGVLRRMPAGTDPSLVQDMIRAEAPFVSPGGEAPLAPLSPAKWLGMSRALVEMGLVTRAEDPAAFVRR